jgi:hypothetical protein
MVLVWLLIPVAVLAAVLIPVALSSAISSRREYLLALKREEARIAEARIRELELQQKRAELEYREALLELERFDREKRWPGLPRSAELPPLDPAGDGPTGPAGDGPTGPAGDDPPESGRNGPAPV